MTYKEQGTQREKCLKKPNTVKKTVSKLAFLLKNIYNAHIVHIPMYNIGFYMTLSCINTHVTISAVRY